MNMLETLIGRGSGHALAHQMLGNSCGVLPMTAYLIDATFREEVLKLIPCALFVIGLMRMALMFSLDAKALGRLGLAREWRISGLLCYSVMAQRRCSIRFCSWIKTS
jgi:hypothetical protein